MKKQVKYFLLSFILIILSPRLGHITLKVLFFNQNQTGSYDLLLNGFIHSFMLIGTLIFVLGLVDLFIDMKK